MGFVFKKKRSPAHHLPLFKYSPSPPAPRGCGGEVNCENVQHKSFVISFRTTIPVEEITVLGSKSSYIFYCCLLISQLKWDLKLTAE